MASKTLSLALAAERDPGRQARNISPAPMAELEPIGFLRPVTTSNSDEVIQVSHPVGNYWTVPSLRWHPFLDIT